MFVYAIIGKSGSGKDYFLNKLNNFKVFDNNIFNKIVSYTTRPPRNGEVHGIDYYFITDEEFNKLIKEEKMLEWTDFNGWKYGTCIDSFDKNIANIGVFNPDGIKSLHKHKDIELFVYIIKATDDKMRMQKILDREKNPSMNEIIRRWTVDEKDFNDVETCLDKLEIPYKVIYNNY